MQEIKRLAIISTHPVQYYGPVFKLLHERGKIAIKVYYSWGEQSLKKYDPGFNKDVEWDLPLLDGYPYEWAENTSSDPGSHHFFGIKTPKLIKQVADFKPDAILVYGWAYHSHLQLIRYFHKKTLVFFRGDSTLLDKAGAIKSMFKKIILTWVYSHIDHAFYAGSRNKEYFMNYGLKENQLSFAPHAVDNGRFAENRQQEALQLRNKLGLKQKDILILFAGKMEAKKDPVSLLKAFLKLDNYTAHLLFVGNGVQERLLKSQTLNLKPNRVHFMNFQNQSNMPVIYQACDLFCLPSTGPEESWGLAVNEAMACGKAILASDKVGCSVDLVKAGFNGEIFNAGNIEDLLLKISMMLDKKKLDEYGKASGELIKSWNYKNQSDAIISRLYE